MKQLSHPLTLSIFFVLISVFSFGQEICNNNIDDDGDRLIDLYDIEDCPCTRADTFKISLIPNPSFENTNCIPSGYSQLNCAEGWEQATLATSDLFSPLGFMPSYVPLPIPDGTNCIGTIIDLDYREYVGTRLNGPLLAGQSYLLKFNVAANTIPEWAFEFHPTVVDLVLFGKTSYESFPLQTAFCPENFGWKEIGRIGYTTQDVWSSISVFFTPEEDIYSVMLGGGCNDSDTPVYILWDNLQLNRADDEIIYYVPNTFTPNGDEHNNIFNPVFVCGYDPLEYRFEIYNRWGEIVFTSLDAEMGWDGTYNGLPTKEGVFGWKLEYKAENTTEKKVLTGHANLLR
ncbi:T9SS type B sorting domain-containing protein [Fluviicola taffensis]|uniref:T9SS type B sorting domain-containing protein n=1 Tax=Fluviicola taffensis TaxID=191579 RepID=UPI003137B849